MSEFDVFLCHNSQDKPEVIKIARQLKQQGLRPWLDVWELPPGKSWQELLEEQIEDVKSAAVFVGSSGLGPWQKREMRAFLSEFVNRGCPVIPVLLENAPQKPELPIFLKALTWVDFRNAESNPMRRLIWGINGVKPPVINPPPRVNKRSPISRKQFLKWAGLGSASLVTAVVAREIFKGPPSISVAKPKYTEGAPKVFGLPLWTVEFETVTVDRKGEVVERDSNKQAKFFKEDLGKSVKLEMVSIPGGKFMMGSPEGEGEDSEKPQHEVTVQPFFMGKYPITQAQWNVIASLPKIKRDLEPDPSHFNKGNDRPVEQVFWEDAEEFCQRLSKQMGKEYRLPSEAEWEYACRAGTKTPFHFGKTITGNLANYRATEIYAEETPGEFRQQTTLVGSFPPNAFGLYDMHGNVWEWCQDDWQDNYEGASKDGSARTLGAGSKKVIRSGSWASLPSNSRSAFRSSHSRVYRNFNVGLRVVCVAPSAT